MFKFSSIALTIAMLASVLSQGVVTNAAGPQERKIVVFEQDFTNEAAQAALIAHKGGTKLKSLPLVNGVVLLGDAAVLHALQGAKEVKRIDDDAAVFAFGQVTAKAGKPAPSQPAQVLPWGIDRIDAEQAWATNTGAAIRVGIIDTGIDMTHPDLQANIRGGANMIDPAKSPNDDNGHGSHVAGIIAGVNNAVGIIGVAPSVDLYAIKVLNRQGSGYISDIIEGLQWSIANQMQAVNMSLGASTDIQSLHDAVIAAANAGIVQVVAAGNDGVSAPVSYPGAYAEVITVSATDQTNTIASFSSRGPAVDIAAPGVSIFSTYKSGGYATLSGTSMATPHVAGVAALVLKTAPGIYDANGDGQWQPQEVQAKLEATATDLGAAGKDAVYGAGLLNAWLASQ